MKQRTLNFTYQKMCKFLEENNLEKANICKEFIHILIDEKINEKGLLSLQELN